MNGKRKRKLYGVLLLGTFLSVLLFECLTPILSDDLTYMRDVQGAGSPADLFVQEARQYLSWTGRSVAHLILRFYLYAFGLHRGVFNVAAALVFTALVLLMDGMASGEGPSRSRDPRRYLLLALGLWLTGVRPGQTVFWMTGAFNYLFTAAIILGFLALYRRWTGAEAASGAPERAARGALLFLAGLLAGWCNENTSGGAGLYVLLTILGNLRAVEAGDRAHNDRPGPFLHPAVLPLRISGLLGVGTGVLMQLLSPGNRGRAALIDEGRTGLRLYAVRLWCLLETVRELFLPLLLVALFLYLLARRQGVSLRDPRLRNAGTFFLLFAATAGCLLLAPSPQARTYFGAGVFLLIACGQLYACVRWDEGAVLPALRDFAVCGLLLAFIFRYGYETGNLVRIRQAVDTRYVLLEEAVRADVRDEDGDLVVKLPMLPEDLDSPYSMARETDLAHPWHTFSNMQMAEYFGADYIIGVPYDTYGEERP